MKQYKVGYTSGVYDMFHIGHLNILKRAKERCEYLVVGVSTDELVMEYKNKTPVISYKDRAAIIASIRYVDKVVPQINMDKLSSVKEVNAEVIFVGDDWRGTTKWDEIEMELSAHSIDVVYLPHTEGISSTILTGQKEKRVHE